MLRALYSGGAGGSRRKEFEEEEEEVHREILEGQARLIRELKRERAH